MSVEGQRLDPHRYALIPRTLSFLLNGDDMLLLKTAAGRGAWAGKLNGVGGHIERGEDPRSAAVREIEEETGLPVEDLQLCGIVTIDIEPELGISLFVFAGTAPRREVRAGPEGQAAWFPLYRLGELELVEDLPVLIPGVLEAHQTGQVFFATYLYEPDGKLRVEFAGS